MKNKKGRSEAEIQGEAEVKKQRTRVRSADFMRIEDTTNSQELAPFELEVKEAITSTKTPLTDLIREEEEKEGDKLIDKVYERVRSAGFSPAQKICFKLLFRDNLSLRQAAKEMRVSAKRVAELKKEVLMKMRKAVAKNLPHDANFRKFLAGSPVYRNSVIEQEI